MSNSFALLEAASNSDPQEIAAKTKEVKQDKPKFVEEKKPTQQRKPKPTTAPSEQVASTEEGFQGTRAKGRGGRPQHHQAPKKGRAFDRHVSGTGVKKGEVKKGGGGKANWGKPTDEKAEEKTVEVASESAGEQQPTEEKKEETTQAETEAPQPVDTSLTLEEYLNQKKTAKVTLKKEAGEQLVTGKNVKLTGEEFARSSEGVFQKEKKKVEKEEKAEKKAEKKPKAIDVSEFLDSASLEKIKERRDKELLEGPKQQRPRTQGSRPTGGRPGNNNNKKGPKQGGNKDKSATGPKKPRPVINKDKDFPALSPQN
ncbi:hypothetical protein C9374_003069 [Naegleria lovaniensis]|uniref:Hyaluronan/mRNA-binding protein domain-containing protein n=1 Tax=Naegleria lovaniensis TaxID=51637 RepID=A0AA88GS94_NAELO|nr:uncharacterized protein C9374_003069 [Naegleria lovaniensis]KAG2385920.1 hypothetical protein C9374_003069 [Naegleria lovaniensis]